MKNHKELIGVNIYCVITLFSGVCYWLGYSVYVLNQTSIYAENGSLENIQVVTLITSCLAFFLPVMRQEREGKLGFLFFSFLCLGFILREVDIENLDIPTALILVGSGMGRNTLLAIGFFSMGVYAMLNSAYYKALARSFIVSIEGLLIIMAGLLLYIGNYFEYDKLIQHHVFLEEMFELFGYISILLAALILLSKNKLSHIAS